MSRLLLPLLNVVLMAAVAACQTAVAPEDWSPALAISPGSTLTLTRALSIPGGTASVYLQSGAVTTYGTMNQYLPNCKFELRTRSEDVRTVAPDVFEITKVSFQEDVMANLNRWTFSGAFIVSDGPTPVPYSTVLLLRSEKQPDVFRMSCMHWQDPSLGGKHLSLRQLRTALGDVFTLRLAP